MMTNTTYRYLKPGWATKNLMNPFAQWLVGRGVSLWGARVLEVEGRRSGQVRSVVVNLLGVDGEEYLVAPRGETQWVKNLRVAGSGTLRVGRRRQAFTAVEVDDAAKPALLREYLKRWKWEVGQFFHGVGPDASDEELASIAPGYPVFRLSTD